MAIAKPIAHSTSGKQGIQVQRQKAFTKTGSVVSDIEITSLQVVHTFPLLTVGTQGSEIQPSDKFPKSFYGKIQTVLALTASAAGITHQNIV